MKNLLLLLSAGSAFARGEMESFKYGLFKSKAGLVLGYGANYAKDKVKSATGHAIAETYQLNNLSKSGTHTSILNKNPKTEDMDINHNMVASFFVDTTVIELKNYPISMDLGIALDLNPVRISNYSKYSKDSKDAEDAEINFNTSSSELGFGPKFVYQANSNFLVAFSFGASVFNAEYSVRLKQSKMSEIASEVRSAESSKPHLKVEFDKLKQHPLFSAQADYNVRGFLNFSAEYKLKEGITAIGMIKINLPKTISVESKDVHNQNVFSKNEKHEVDFVTSLKFMGGFTYEIYDGK